MSTVIDKEKMFSMLWSSDHHNLHPHTPTSYILNNYAKIREEVEVKYSIDLEVWGGDLTHDTTDTSNPDYLYLQKWIRNYLHDCHIKKRTVRILAGTSSHDYEQPKLFELLKPKGSKYVKYIDRLEIEYLEDFNIHILYVPDNFGKKPKQEIYEEALNLIASFNLKQVDFIFLHGAFDFQLPILKTDHKESLYDSLQWSKLAKLGIFSGHIHKPSHKYNIYSSGSFDRIAFGEMHPKGAYQVYFNKDKMIPIFIENKRAMIYDTIKITPETEQKELIRILDKYLSKQLPKHSNIRIEGGNSEIVRPVLNEYKEVYPSYRFETKNAIEEGIKVDDVLYDPEDYQAIAINKDNLDYHLFNFMEKDKKNYLDLDKDYLQKLLGEMKENVK